jgi:DNA-binding PadR family transcriptional regulator
MSPVFRHGGLRLYLLKLLDEAPRHGYEVIRLLQDRFLGVYAPSPGTIYPRLARLEEEGLVTHDEVDGKKIYRITDAGREEIQSRLDDLAELEEELTESVRDIAREVTHDVRDTVRNLREELTWAARHVRSQSREQARTSARERARQAREAVGESARRARDETRGKRDRDGQTGQDPDEQPRQDRDEQTRRDRGSGPWPDWAAFQDWQSWAGWRERTGKHGWPSFGGFPAGAGAGAGGPWAGATREGSARPDAGLFRDLERLAIDFARELRNAAWHTESVGENALSDLRAILEDTLARVRDEVFGAGGARAPAAESSAPADPPGPADSAGPAAEAGPDPEAAEPGHAEPKE